MVKLQRIKRSNGSLVFSMNFPLELIESLGWEKGDDLIAETKMVDGQPVIAVFNEGKTIKKGDNKDGRKI